MSEFTVTPLITPNPDAKTFITDKTIIESNGYIEVTEETQNISELPALCAELICLPFVKRVLVMNNFVTVVKAANARWDNILSEIQRVIETRLPDFSYSFCANRTQLDDETSKIKNILDSYIGPAIAVDGGAIRYHSFDKESGVLTVDVLGSCHGCPSLINTLERGIEPMIKDMFPQVNSVIRLKK
ncbi:NifU family protein [Microcoleus sp. B5-C4]|uniref:NifU family protein n=1 Tax=Microcoleus sp. B5-C4 TaxID=2818675 RepID=UPI002FD47A1A